MENNYRNYLLVIWGLILILFFSKCGNKLNIDFVQVGKVKISVPPNWHFKQLASDKFEISTDTIKIIGQWDSDSSLSNMHLRDEWEYLTTTDPNVLTGFAFNEPGVIYTNKENVDLVKSKEGDFHKLNNVKANPEAVLERILKIEDSVLLADGIDYLCRFKINGEQRWIPVKLPGYFKVFRFETHSTAKAYCKLYYPVNGNVGRCGLFIKSLNQHSVFSARSTLVKDKDRYYKDVIAILKSVTFDDNGSIK